MPDRSKPPMALFDGVKPSAPALGASLPVSAVAVSAPASAAGPPSVALLVVLEHAPAASPTEPRARSEANPRSFMMRDLLPLSRKRRTGQDMLPADFVGYGGGVGAWPVAASARARSSWAHRVKR